MGVHAPHLPLAADPLIDEANRRKRRRRLIVAGVFAVVALAAGLTLALRPRGPGDPSPGGPTHSSGAADTTRPEARDIAERLIRTIPLPPGARRVSERAGGAVASAPDYGTNVFTQYAYRHAFWRVREPLATVAAYLRRHPARGLTLAAVAETWPHDGVSFNGRSVGGRIANRVLVSLIPSKGATTIRVDAGVPWTVPRSPREVLPASVREIDIHSVVTQPFLRRAGARSVSRRLTDPVEVARITRWFNELNVVQPNTQVLCRIVLSAPVQFTFRSVRGAELASAIAPSGAASSCGAIQFTLDGQTQKPLIDSTPEHGMAFIDRIQRLLGVRFSPRTGRF